MELRSELQISDVPLVKAPFEVSFLSNVFLRSVLGRDREAICPQSDESIKRAQLAPQMAETFRRDPKWPELGTMGCLPPWAGFILWGRCFLQPSSAGVGWHVLSFPWILTGTEEGCPRRMEGPAMSKPQQPGRV